VRFGRLVAVVVTTTLRFVLEIVPPEPPPVELRPCEQAIEEKADDGEDRVAARVPGLPPCPREVPRKCADA